ncbi:MAG: nuclear transport factor 2 family protein [Gaiellaceae bacterium]
MDPLETFEALFHRVCDERDPDGATALWADDDDVTLFGSERTDTARGPAEIREHMDAIANAGATIRFVWNERHAHVEGEVAWVTAAGTLTIDDRASPYQAACVLVRRDGTWRLHTFSGSEPR